MKPADPQCPRAYSSTHARCKGTWKSWPCLAGPSPNATGGAGARATKRTAGEVCGSGVRKPWPPWPSWPAAVHSTAPQRGLHSAGQARVCRGEQIQADQVGWPLPPYKEQPRQRLASPQAKTGSSLSGHVGKASPLWDGVHFLPRNCLVILQANSFPETHRPPPLL